MRLDRTHYQQSRLAMALGMIVSIALFTGAGFKPGEKRWGIKTSLAAHADVSHPKQVGFIDLLGLEDAPGVTKDDSRYQSALIPAFANPLNLKEGDIVSVSGWLHLVAGES